MNQATIEQIVRELTDKLYCNGFLSRQDAFDFVLRNFGMDYTSPELGLAGEVARQFKDWRGPNVEWSFGRRGWVVK
jgi:hypothetical protein